MKNTPQNDVTFCGHVGRAQALEMQAEKREQERQALRKQGEDAIREVREALLHNLPTMPEQHREAIKSIFGIN